jgi:hypothetical protein
MILIVIVIMILIISPAGSASEGDLIRMTGRRVFV